MSKLFAFSVMVVIAVLASGCGYKAPPYYEKSSSAQGSSVAL